MSATREVRFGYGANGVRLTLPAGRFTTLTGTPPAAGSEPAGLLRAALDAPVDAPPLRALVRGGDRVTIVVSDGTRVTGAGELLPELLRYLDDAGVPASRVRILFALGIHRRQTAAERAAIIGAEVAERVENVDHDCDDEASLTELGSNGATAGVRLNRLLLDGSLVIATGAIGFHYLAGFGGGRKSILPGVAGRASVRDFHSRSLDPAPGGARHPRVAPGVRAGNPMDEVATTVATALPRAFLINTIMAKGIAAIVAGDVARAFDHGCARYREWFTLPIPARRPVVVVSAGGAPRDRDLVQSQKAIAAGAAALAPGGRMLVLAECGEGTGNAELASWFDHPDRAAHVAALRARFSVPGQTALALREHAERCRISLYSALPPDLVARSGMTPVAHPDEFFAAVTREYGGDVEGFVLPEGGRYLPVVDAGARPGAPA